MNVDIIKKAFFCLVHFSQTQIWGNWASREINYNLILRALDLQCNQTFSYNFEHYVKEYENWLLIEIKNKITSNLSFRDFQEAQVNEMTFLFTKENLKELLLGPVHTNPNDYLEFKIIARGEDIFLDSITNHDETDFTFFEELPYKLT